MKITLLLASIFYALSTICQTNIYFKGSYVYRNAQVLYAINDTLYFRDSLLHVFKYPINGLTEGFQDYTTLPYSGNYYTQNYLSQEKHIKAMKISVSSVLIAATAASIALTGDGEFVEGAYALYGASLCLGVASFFTHWKAYGIAKKANEQMMAEEFVINR
jgi:hypothetical protein